MNKATPVQLRQGLQMTEGMVKAGIRFVPMAVLDEDDFLDQVAELNRRLELIEAACGEDT